MKKRELFKLEGDSVNRIRKHCPKCGPGVFLAEHNDRSSCGKCGYTEFKGGVRKEKNSFQKQPNEKLKEEKTEKEETQDQKESETEKPKNEEEPGQIEKENKKE